jgi:hypothetical protein
MKYALTGHTKGIGKKLYEKLNPNVLGFSKSTGYDITKKEDREKIIEQSKDCSIFINNASENFGQTLLFLELFELWKNNHQKTIINVGSRIADIFILPEENFNLVYYQSEKIILKEMSRRVKGKCKVVYKTFSYVGTEKILKKYPYFTQNDYITEEQAVEIILS